MESLTKIWREKENSNGRSVVKAIFSNGERVHRITRKSDKKQTTNNKLDTGEIFVSTIKSLEVCYVIQTMRFLSSNWKHFMTLFGTTLKLNFSGLTYITK